ncbi:cupredoxin domain-containing protein [Candidatus Pacearchaeota archaeon]|nr:cupredoxin domain-containing protein [Candidatus Pacearchaeota archaeon]
MNKIVISIIIIVLIALGAFYLLNKSSLTGNVVVDTEKIAGNNVGSNSNVQVFVVDSSHLRFYIDGVENPDMVVKKGDKVRVEFTSSEGFHDWVIDEFGAATERVMPGNSTSVEFVADKKGTFEYYCSFGKHRQNGMKGKFIVE